MARSQRHRSRPTVLTPLGKVTVVFIIVVCAILFFIAVSSHATNRGVIASGLWKGASMSTLSDAGV